MGMTGSLVLDRALLVVLLVGVVIGAGRWIRGRRRPEQVDHYLSARDADIAHVIMNLAMAWMLTPWWSGSVGTVMVIVFAVLAAVFAVLLVAGLGRPALGSRRPAHAYHLLAAATMAYATALTAPAAGHDGHGAMAHGATPHDAMSGYDPGTVIAAGPPAVPVVIWALVALFAIDLLATVIIVGVAPRLALATDDDRRPPATGGRGDVAVAPRSDTVTSNRIRTLRVATVPHAVMDLAMVVMLVAVAP